MGKCFADHLLMKQHQKEIGIVSPHLVEIDIDSDEYYKQSWDKGGARTFEGRRKGRLKRLVRKKKKGKMVTSSTDGGNMMVVTDLDFATPTMEASATEVPGHRSNSPNPAQSPYMKWSCS